MLGHCQFCSLSQFLSYTGKYFSLFLGFHNLQIVLCLTRSPKQRHGVAIQASKLRSPSLTVHQETASKVKHCPQGSREKYREVYGGTRLLITLFLAKRFNKTPAFAGSGEPATAGLCLPDANNKSPIAVSLIKNYCFIYVPGAHLSSGKIEYGHIRRFSGKCIIHNGN